MLLDSLGQDAGEFILLLSLDPEKIGLATAEHVTVSVGLGVLLPYRRVNLVIFQMTVSAVITNNPLK